MGSAKPRLTTFDRALRTLEEIAGEPASGIVRDAMIQRFEYTTETAWKAARHYLLEYEGIECNTPKSSIRAAFEAGLLSEGETELLLKMIDDRNLTSHTYIEAIAARIASAIPAYAAVMRTLADMIVGKMGD